MKKVLLAILTLAFLSTGVFAADPYSFSKDLRKGTNYDEQKASAVFSSEGLRITVKPSNFVWGHTFHVPDSTRYLNLWDIGVQVKESNGASFGIGIGHAKTGITFCINAYGKYEIGSWGGSAQNRKKQGNIERLTFPVKMGVKYNISKAEMIFLINDSQIATLKPEEFTNMPQLTTIKIVRILTMTDWGKQNGSAVYENININAYNDESDLSSETGESSIDLGYLANKEANCFSTGVNGIKWKDSISNYKKEMRVVKKMENGTILYTRNDSLDIAGVKLDVVYDFTNGKFEGVIGNGKGKDFEKIKEYFTDMCGPVLIKGENYTWVSKDNIAFILNEEGVVYIIDQKR